jgi:hypothetical protein
LNNVIDVFERLKSGSNVRERNVEERNVKPSSVIENLENKYGMSISCVKRKKKNDEFSSKSNGLLN